MFKYVSPVVTSVSLTQISLTQQQSYLAGSMYTFYNVFLLSASLMVVKIFQAFGIKDKF